MQNSPTPPTLSNEINTATRTLHTSLNRLITSRLPLALPPHTPDPTLYTTGLLHFAHIFLTFESLWTDLLSSTSVSPSAEPPTSPLLSFLLVNPYDSPELFSAPPSQEMLDFLTRLRPRGLARSGRIKRDLEMLTGLHRTDLEVLLAQYPGSKVEEYCSHIRRQVRCKPHLLVAYAWCYYMAVFSGGRWIRQQLVEAGDDFWRTSTAEDTREKTEQKATPLAERGLSLWNFDGEHDGEDIKAAFKKRLMGAEDLFTDDERVDVIEEAKQIFKFSAALVDELDEKLGTYMEMLSQPRRVEKDKSYAKASVDQPTALSFTAKATHSAVTWYRKPEITGAVLALGCLACVAMIGIDSKMFL